MCPFGLDHPINSSLTLYSLGSNKYNISNNQASQEIPLSGTDLASISALRTYYSLVSNVKLSLSNGGQVFQDVWLRRDPGARLYQKGNHGYQNIPRKERQSFLLIDGQPTTEVDFTTLHPCIFLNREGRECPKDMYSEVLKQLGIRKSKKRRAAIKNVILSALNMNTVHGIYTFTGQQESYQGNLKDHCKPIDIYNAIITLYPELKQYLGDGDNSDRLQAADSIIMIDILERLAKMGIVGLPLHDSVICKVPHKAIVEREMKAVYEAYMGFDIHVK